MATGRIPDPNTAPLTAKGDLYTYSTVPARQAVGSDGDTLVADSSATTGLRWQGNYSAGKNVIINGDFRINQRAFTSTTTSGTFGFDRWYMVNTGGTGTYSAQTFTAGTAPVSGYEGINFARVASTGQSAAGDRTMFIQNVEDGRTFAGQTATISFWAKASSGTPKVALELYQDFGSGGSPSSFVTTYAGQVTLSTSWARYSITVAVPSASGKTFGTTANTSYLGINFWTSAGSTYNSRTGTLGIQTATIDFWGVQAEAGSVATAFQTATGTLAGELAACQRYYWRTNYSTAVAYGSIGTGFTESTTGASLYIQYPVPMRVAPTSIDSGNLSLVDSAYSGGATTAISIGTDGTTERMAKVSATVASGLTANRPALLRGNNNTASYFGMSAEL